MVRALVRRLLGRGDARTSGIEESAASNSDPDHEEESNGEEPTRDDVEEDDDSVWDFIPYWQYNGRHVESGGATKGEQERALRDIQEQARAIEASEEAHAMEHSEDR